MIPFSCSHALQIAVMTCCWASNGFRSRYDRSGVASLPGVWSGLDRSWACWASRGAYCSMYWSRLVGNTREFLSAPEMIGDATLLASLETAVLLDEQRNASG